MAESTTERHWECTREGCVAQQRQALELEFCNSIQRVLWRVRATKLEWEGNGTDRERLDQIERLRALASFYLQRVGMTHPSNAGYARLKRMATQAAQALNDLMAGRESTGEN